MTRGIVGGKAPGKEEPDAVQKIDDVYLAVFFDGTNNNMVQKARFTGTAKNVFAKGAQSLWYMHKKAFWYISDKFTPVDEATKNVFTEEKYTERDPEARGYSNIAFLHDMCCLEGDASWKQRAGNSISKVFYIEGAGANDTSKLISGNPNGLGFGLGNTGVTALVSKAVKWVTDFVESCGLDKSDAHIHFYVYGFSRGAACARLFSRLVTRGNKGGEIAREKEFAEHSAKGCFKGGRLNFLNDYPKKTVECLGIYDTVVSIGFLMQRDGLVHPQMRHLYDLGENYSDNWHYLNVSDYGMSLNDGFAKDIKKIYHICALDEFRENFALTDVGASVPGNAAEILVPGCHSDVGGGYRPDEEEQEIVLAKRRPHNFYDERAGCEASGTDVATWVSSDPPLEPDPSRKEAMSINAMTQLGWIIDDGRGGRSSGPYTLRALDNKDSIKFKRKVKGVYSHITLQMMIRFANGNVSAPAPIFQSADQNPHITIPGDLRGTSMAKVMLASASAPSFGKREWICPKEEHYKLLRTKYLHFTCTSAEGFLLNNMFNFKGVHTIEGTLGNLGNTPNFDLRGRLCRIVYHGDPAKPTSVGQALHYMYEYGKTGMRQVTCDLHL